MSPDWNVTIVVLKQSEDALRERDAQLYTVINNITQGLAMYDGDGRLSFCNGLYATMYGMSASGVLPGRLSGSPRSDVA